jgi:hypothetical protein
MAKVSSLCSHITDTWLSPGRQLTVCQGGSSHQKSQVQNLEHTVAAGTGHCPPGCQWEALRQVPGDGRVGNDGLQGPTHDLMQGEWWGVWT